jgi:Tol biopolymer transport system component
MTSGETQVYLENQRIIGYAWRPGTYEIAYGKEIDQNFFLTQDPDLASGLGILDTNTGQVNDFVLPERGFPLVNPQWSPDGRLVGFDEVYLMEGRGMFAYYDVESQQYHAWEEPIGFYSWSPDAEIIAYDRLTYTPTMEERIYLNSLDGGQERMISPDYENGYAFMPVFSPQGSELAYLAELTGPDSQQYTIFVIDIASGEPRSLGVFESVPELRWSPDGQKLVYSAGPFGNRQVMIIDVEDSSVDVIASGYQPEWQPASPGSTED